MILKTAAYGACVIASLFLHRACADEAGQKNAGNAPASTSPFGELLSTLKLAYDLRLDEYKAAKSTPEHLIRVNQQLYMQQSRIKIAGKELGAEKKYLERARQIEEIAATQVKDGIGSKVALLDAKVARLLAQMELHERQTSDVQKGRDHPFFKGSRDRTTTVNPSGGSDGF